MKWYKLFESKEKAREVLGENKMLKVEAGGRMICLAHTSKGFFAVDDECPHLGDSLSRGTLNGFNEVICPWHSYRFSLYTGEESDQKCGAVRRHEIRLEENGVFLGVKE